MLTDFIIGRIKAELPFVPNEEKEGLFEALGAFMVSRDERKAFILRGYAGTGKTSVVSALVRALQGLKQPCVLLAPTGRAAKVLSRYSGAPAYTIHKFIYRQQQLGKESFTLSDNIRRSTLFIVDEASMLSGRRDNAAFGSGCLLDDLVKYVYNGMGCSLLLLGDDAQLPPVGSEESPALSEEWMRGYGLQVTGYGLREVARQALDSGILSEATRLREKLESTEYRIQSTEYRIQSTDRISIQPDGKDIIRLNGEEVIETIEQSRREVGEEEVLIITRSNRMTNLYNQGVRARILWKEDELSNGDRVMVSKNNYFWAEEYDNLEFLANGDMMQIKRIYNHHEMYGFHFAKAELMAVDYDWEIEALVWLDTLTTDSPEVNNELQKKLFAAVAEDYPEIRDRKELIKRVFESPYYNALQIRFAYAVTCHKAQGGQWKHVYIDEGPGVTGDGLRVTGDGLREPISQREQLRWLYTALTRATERVYLLR